MNYNLERILYLFKLVLIFNDGCTCCRHLQNKYNECKYENECKHYSNFEIDFQKVEKEYLPLYLDLFKN